MENLVRRKKILEVVLKAYPVTVTVVPRVEEDAIYADLTRRFQHIERRLSEEWQLELDGALTNLAREIALLEPAAWPPKKA